MKYVVVCQDGYRAPSYNTKEQAERLIKELSEAKIKGVCPLEHTIEEEQE